MSLVAARSRAAATGAARRFGASRCRRALFKYIVQIVRADAGVAALCRSERVREPR